MPRGHRLPRTAATTSPIAPPLNHQPAGAVPWGKASLRELEPRLQASGAQKGQSTAPTQVAESPLQRQQQGPPRQAQADPARQGTMLRHPSAAPQRQPHGHGGDHRTIRPGANAQLCAKPMRFIAKTPSATHQRNCAIPAGWAGMVLPQGNEQHDNARAQKRRRSSATAGMVCKAMLTSEIRGAPHPQTSSRPCQPTRNHGALRACTLKFPAYSSPSE